jgi:arylsulfatase A-like enzyme
MRIWRQAMTGGAALALAMASACQANTPEISNARPNIILILADDLGYNDISLNGSRLVSTPNIDSLAADGARFTRAYSGDAVCAPSRAAIMTGRYPQRFGFESNPLSTRPATEVLAAQADGRPLPASAPPVGSIVVENQARAKALDQQGIPDSEVTVFKALQQSGYRTGMFGKWHLGYAPNLAPANRGFDEAVYVPGGAAMYADKDDPDVVNGPLEWSSFDTALWGRLQHDLVRDGVATPSPKYITYQLADEASDFIMRNAKSGEPFAAYVAFTAPHNPLQAPRDIYDRMDHIPEHHLRVYYSAIAALDLAVGQILQALDEAGVADNTIVVFASDNGGATYVRNPASNIPFRGGKTTYYEGGLRVPLMVRWPAQISRGAEILDVASLIDLAPTFVDAANASAGLTNALDGVSLLPAFRNEPPLPGPRTLFFRSEHYHAVIRGNYKLQISSYPAFVRLYDIQTDVHETNDLAASMPDLVHELAQLVSDHDRELQSPSWPVLVRKPIAIDGEVRSPPGPGEEIVYWPLSSAE